MAERKRSLTEKQELFLKYLFDDECLGDFRTAMKKAGYKDTHDYMSVVKSLKDEILEYTETYMALHAPMAAAEMLGIVRDPAQVGSRDKLNALKEVADRGGLVKVDKHELRGDGSTGAIFVLPAKNAEPDEE